MTERSKNFIYILIVVLAGFGGTYLLLNQINKLANEDTQPILKEQPLVTEKPAQDEVKDWKMYRNEEYGFELQHPNNWSIDTSNHAVDLRERGFEMEGVYISKYKREQDYTKVCQSTIFANRKAYKCTFSFGELGGVNSIVVSNGGTAIELQDISQNATSNKILSSFKFIEPQEQDAGEIGKGYSSQKYGFEIRYPRNWIRDTEGIEDTEKYIVFIPEDQQNKMYPFPDYTIVIEEIGNTPFESWFTNRYEGHTNKPTKNSFLFNESINAWKISDPETIGGCAAEYIMIYRQGVVFTLPDPDCDKVEEIKQISSSFDFY